jgi:hypothetical protein
MAEAMSMGRSCRTWLRRRLSLSWLVRRRGCKGRMSRVVLRDSVVLLGLLRLLSVKGLVSLLMLLRHSDWVALERVRVGSGSLVLVLRRRRTWRRGREVLLL